MVQWIPKTRLGNEGATDSKSLRSEVVDTVRKTNLHGVDEISSCDLITLKMQSYYLTNSHLSDSFLESGSIPEQEWKEKLPL